MNNKKIYFWAIISKTMSVIITLINTALINRTLGVTLKGEYTYIINLVAVMYVVLSMGTGVTYVTFKKTYKNKEVKNVFFTIIFLQTLFCIILALVTLSINYNYFLVLILSAIYILKSNLLCISAVENVKERDKQVIVYHFINLIFVIIAYIFFKHNLRIMYLIYFAEALITSLSLIFTFSFKLVNYSIIKKYNLKKIILLGLFTMLMQLMITLNYNLDVILLKRLTNNLTYVGLYSVAVNLGNMIWLIPDAFRDVVFNKTAVEDSIKEIVNLIKVNILIAIIIIVGFVIFGRYFINLFYGNEYLDAFYITIILFLGCMSMIIYKLIHPLYIANGKQKTILTILFISVLINVILNYIFIPKYNIYGAALSSVFSYSLCSVIFLVLFCKEYNVRIKNILFINKSDIDFCTNLIKKLKQGSKVKL